jgi:hypothetical protein
MDRGAATAMIEQRLRLTAAAGGGRGPEIVPARAVTGWPRPRSGPDDAPGYIKR